MEISDADLFVTVNEHQSLSRAAEMAGLSRQARGCGMLEGRAAPQNGKHQKSKNCVSGGRRDPLGWGCRSGRPSRRHWR